MNASATESVLAVQSFQHASAETLVGELKLFDVVKVIEVVEQLARPRLCARSWSRYVSYSPFSPSLSTCNFVLYSIFS